MTAIPYDAGMRVLNLDALPRGTGARFLEVTEGESGAWIAKAWRRKLPGDAGTAIDFAKAP